MRFIIFWSNWWRAIWNQEEDEELFKAIFLRLRILSRMCLLVKVQLILVRHVISVTCKITYTTLIHLRRINTFWSTTRSQCRSLRMIKLGRWNQRQEVQVDRREETALLKLRSIKEFRWWKKSGAPFLMMEMRTSSSERKCKINQDSFKVEDSTSTNLWWLSHTAW